VLLTGACCSLRCRSLRVLLAARAAHCACWAVVPVIRKVPTALSARAGGRACWSPPCPCLFLASPARAMHLPLYEDLRAPNRKRAPAMPAARGSPRGLQSKGLIFNRAPALPRRAFCVFRAPRPKSRRPEEVGTPERISGSADQPRPNGQTTNNGPRKRAESARMWSCRLYLPKVIAAYAHACQRPDLPIARLDPRSYYRSHI
jgi:hypothetical protein